MKWAGIGLLSGLTAFYLLTIWQPALRPAWVAHAVVLGIVLICGAAALAPRSGLPAQARTASASFGAALLLCLTASLTSLQTVAERAAEAAKDAPYCIQIADNWRGSYEPARAWLDLSGLTL